jgi:C4-dicarboxylate transporter
MDLLVELFRLGVRLLDRRAIEPIIAVLVLHFTAMFVEIAGNLGSANVLLYWLCVVIAVITGIIGLGGAGLYAWRMLFPNRVSRAGSEPTPD